MDGALKQQDGSGLAVSIIVYLTRCIAHHAHFSCIYPSNYMYVRNLYSFMLGLCVAATRSCAKSKFAGVCSIYNWCSSCTYTTHCANRWTLNQSVKPTLIVHLMKLLQHTSGMDNSVQGSIVMRMNDRLVY